MAGMEVSGLIDHGTFHMPIASGGSKALSISGTGPEESQPFSRPLALGSGKFIFIEDCTFNYGGHNDGAMDAYGGARYVFRHNTVNNTNVEHHGADSGGFRGVHSFEIYNNAFRCTGACASQRKHYFRSGTGVIFNNTYSGNYYDGAELTNYRSDESFPPWGKCDGTSPWDQNKPGQNGYACLDQIGHVFGPAPGGANILEPLYEWNNTHDGADVDLFVGTAARQCGPAHRSRSRLLQRHPAPRIYALPVSSPASKWMVSWRPPLRRISSFNDPEARPGCIRRVVLVSSSHRPVRDLPPSNSA